MRIPMSQTRPRTRSWRVALAVAACCCASPTAFANELPRNPDPLEKLNRATHAFNDALDRMLARPAAKAYRKVAPEPVRNAVSNFVANLAYPTTAVNSALQGKFRDAGTDTLRFVVNSTIGIGGLGDPATKFGLPAHDEDFGQTLGAWGVPAGPYLVLPFLGPSTVRDTPARVPDIYTHGRRYVGSGTTTDVSLLGVEVLDQRTELLAADNALQQAFDPYALVRDAYLQRREYVVRDGNVPESEYEDELLEEPIPVDAPTADTAPPAGDDGAEPVDGDPSVSVPPETSAPETTSTTPPPPTL